jgi:hypothetical protein
MFSVSSDRLVVFTMRSDLRVLLSILYNICCKRLGVNQHYKNPLLLFIGMIVSNFSGPAEVARVSNLQTFICSQTVIPRCLLLLITDFEIPIQFYT